ncbi:aldo/keto reductase [Vibrio fluvialis]|nr:aldo/keto reductase [Vibrio fluvialis]
MKNSVPQLKLNNGVLMPSLGLGVFQSAPEDTAKAVQTALEAGYRHIDTAAAYFNEREVGEGIKRAGIDRSEIFVETKIWINDYGKGATHHAFEKSAKKLGVDTIDLLILHQPFPSQFDLSIEAYKDLELLLEEGKVRAIGVSNFMPEHLEKLLAETCVIPAVNQIELHPYFQQKAVQELNAKHGIISQAWSPIGGITFYPGWGNGHTSTLENPVILQLAEKYGKTPAQIMLNWHISHGRSVIPKSTNPLRIKENLDVFDFSLTDNELAEINALDTSVRGGPEPDSINLETYGAEIPEA